MTDTKGILKKVGIFIGIILAAIFSWEFIVEPLINFLPSWGAETTQTAILAPNWINSILTVLVGQISLTWESLIVVLALMAILLFGLQDIIFNFSTFSETTSWAISVGLVLIAAVTRVISGLMAALFGGVAGIGALGIAIIVVWAIFIAVGTNILIGLSGIKEMKEKRQDQEDLRKAARKMKKGFAFLRGASDTSEES